MQYQPSMSKIYSRKRIKKFKPKKYYWRKNKSKNSKSIFYIAIMIVAILVYLLITKSFEPIFDKICMNEANSIATKVVNDESTKAIQNYTYNDLYTIERDSSRKYSDDKC